MLDITKQLLNLIEAEVPLNKISEILELNYETLYKYIYSIEQEGIKLERLYYSTGDIIYKIINPKVSRPSINTNIITNKNENKLTFLVISDIHLGSSFERIDILYKLYEYCYEEGIHLVLCGGDLIDGNFSRHPPKIPLIIDQIDYLIKNYPNYHNILTFTVLGNHDYCAYKSPYGGLIKILNKYRHDIIPLGYAIGKINIKNDYLILKHHIKNYKIQNITNSTIALKAHSHHYKLSCKTNNCTVTLPSLSNLNFSFEDTTQLTPPSALIMTISFNNDLISQLDIAQLIITDEIYPVNNININLSSTKKGDFNNIINYDINKTSKTKVLKLTNQK